MEQARIVKSATEMRTLARRGEWHGTTAGHCSAYQQANLVILPKEAAPEFAAFCTRNPKPCGGYYACIEVQPSQPDSILDQGKFTDPKGARP